MDAIVMVDKEWAVSSNGVQPIHLIYDQARFKALTLGKAIIYGRKTYEQLPANGLPGRTNYVITSNKDFSAPSNIKVFHSVEEALQSPISYNAVVIGGASIYEQMIPYCEQVLVTQVDTIFSNPVQKITDLSRHPDKWAKAMQEPICRIDVDMHSQFMYYTTTTAFFARNPAKRVTTCQ